MSSCTLNWYPDRGFELDLDAENDEVTLRMVAVPVPVDGTGELSAAPVPLDRLEILFKAQVDVLGEPGQLQEAQVQLVQRDGRSHLELAAKVEDVETGDLIPLTASVPVEVPPEAPEAGGPRPKPPDEDELDWEDETTLEQMIVNPPEPGGREPSDDKPAGGGLKALLAALENLGDEGEGDDDEPPLPGLAELMGKGSAAAPPAAADEIPEEPEPDAVVEGAPGDQIISPEEEAAGLLQLLIDRDGLELEDDFSVEDLVPGVVQILAGPSSTEAKAGALSAWLLDHPAVADLYLADEDLAEILEQW